MAGPSGNGAGDSYPQGQRFPDARPYLAVAPGVPGAGGPAGVAGGAGRATSGPQQALGYAEHERGAHGFIPHGYDAQGYAMPGYAEPVPTGPDYPDSGFGNRGYGPQDPTPQAYPQVLSAPVEPAPPGMGRFTGPMPAIRGSRAGRAASRPVGRPGRGAAGRAIPARLS